MDETGIAKAIGWPGPVVADSRAAARERARFLNEFGAAIVRRHPDRFGLFASIPPLGDVDGALAEIDYAMDVLHADGIGMVTHYGESWLGDAAFMPVFQELDRRHAVVYVHPQGANGECGCGMQGYQTPPMSAAWLEYPFNTARCILNLMGTGTLRRFPKIRFIFCHGGGAFTPLIGRLNGFSGWFDMGNDKLAEIFPEGIDAEFQRLYFECAQAYSPESMALLLSRIPSSQLLFGSDYDRFSLRHSVEELGRLDLSTDIRAALEYGNAQRLFETRWATMATESRRDAVRQA